MKRKTKSSMIAMKSYCYLCAVHSWTLIQLPNSKRKPANQRKRESLPRSMSYHCFGFFGLLDQIIGPRCQLGLLVVAVPQPVFVLAPFLLQPSQQIEHENRGGWARVTERTNRVPFLAVYPHIHAVLDLLNLQNETADFLLTGDDLSLQGWRPFSRRIPRRGALADCMGMSWEERHFRCGCHCCSRGWKQRVRPFW